MARIKVKTDTPVDAETLRGLLAAGVDHPLIRARLRHSQASTFDKYLKPLDGVDRCYPSVLMTQASGRWSYSDPPFNNFAKDDVARQRGLPQLRRVITPDPGTYWLGWDWEAIEAKLVAAYSGDQADLDAFAQGWDVHTLTACAMYQVPRPPVLTKLVHTAPEAEDWRQSWTPCWGGGDDMRRVLAKCARYAMFYGPNSPHVILEARGFEELGVTPEMALDAAGAFLTAKRATLVRWKERTWAECIRTREARTFLGRRRRLFGESVDVAKKGLNHIIQGAVSQVMDLTLDAVCFELGTDDIAQQAHDGAKVVVADAVAVEMALAKARPIVEKTWEIGGRTVKFTADWEITRSDGVKEKVKW